MSETKNKLKKKFLDSNRYSNFGHCLRKVHIHGFRGISEMDLTIDHPITAISGLNGAGKSTLGQIAICAYKKPTTANNYKRHYIKDFFPISAADPKPISENAKSIYTYETEDFKKPREVTISRASSSWSGYKRQPERHCFYIGFTVYIPKVERRDLSVYGGASLKVTAKRDLDNDVIEKMARIIGHKYETVGFQGISHKERESEIGIASRLGYSYSENNMGFGEGRILYTVNALETSPVQSLFILEEPETSLHESAQHEFSKYLIDVCNRRHHQIIISTHSSVILNSLPPESRKLMIRDKSGVEIRNKISSNQVRSILSSGHERPLDIIVEDIFAKVLLCEAIRKKRRHLLKIVAITEIGCKDAVKEAILVLRKTGKNAIAIRDADVGQSPADGLFSFPGSKPPEVEVFENELVKNKIKDKYDIDIEWILQRENVKDHHKIAGYIAREAEAEEEVIRTTAIECYIDSIESEFDHLIEQIEKSIG